MKKIIFGLSLLLNCNFINAQILAFAVPGIPDSLKKNANVIIQNDETFVHIKNNDEVLTTIKKTMIVVNEKAKSELFINIPTSKIMSLEDAEVYVYDAMGKQIEKAKKKDFQTIAIGTEFIDDVKQNIYKVSSSAYPITLKYEYTYKSKSNLLIEPFIIQTPESSVIYAKYTLKLKKDNDINYKLFNTNIQPIIDSTETEKTYMWEVKNKPALEYEIGGARGYTKYPSIIFSPNKFSFFGLDGDLSSWNGFGAFNANLYNGTEVLDEKTIEHFKKITENATNDREKAKIVYEYLQKNFRYVSIQLGIGGWKPFDAKFVNEKKYGDCKALSNYTRGALKVLGINSHVAIINAGFNNEPVDPSFPSDKFNHVILCIPGQKDSIWLECTSSTADFGVLGNFTENRNALLVTENGGVLVPTPKSKPTDNIQNTYNTITLAEDGSGTVKSIINSTGEYKQDVINYLLNETRDEQQKFIVNYKEYKHPDVFEININKENNYQTELNLTYEKVPEFSAGSKMFLPSSICKLVNGNLPNTENRKTDFYFECPFLKTDTTEIKLPTGFIVDNLPKNKTLECKYGSYSRTTIFNTELQTISVVKKVKLTQFKIPATDYIEVKKFFSDITDDENQKIVVKKT